MYDDHDPDAPIPFDTEIEDEDDGLDTCESCGAEISALGDYCPKCGHWQTEAGSGWKLDLRRPYRNTKFIAVVILLFSLLVSIWMLWS